MEEEEFYGGGKGERDPRRKEKEMMIRKGSGIVVGKDSLHSYRDRGDGHSSCYYRSQKS
mgnify:CR=1 FL=1